MSEKNSVGRELFAWMASQTDPAYTVTETSEDRYDEVCFRSEYAAATAAIHYLEYTICELRVTDHSGENIYYLHFEVNDPDHAKELFLQMKELFMKQKEDNTLHVLLCCSCGLTTSYFTMKLNEAAQMMNLKMDFEAVPYEGMYESAQNKDVILIAPQIGYQTKKAKEILKDKTVLPIPSALFAQYDVLGLINFIRSEYKEEEKKETSESGSRILAGSGGTILLVSVIDMEGRTQLAYRLYDGKKVILENQIIKPVYRAEDLIDVIGSVTKLNSTIDTIGLISPGSFVDGKLTYEKENIFAFDITENIEKRFGCRTFVLNDTDAIALGYSEKELNGEQTAFYFVPTGSYAGSIGLAADGKIYGNAGHMGGGQLSGITDITTFPKNPYVLARTPEGNIALAARYLTGLITYTGCPHIAFYAKMIPDTEELIREIRQFIQPEYIPEIVKIASVRDYLYDGAMYYIENRKDH